ncbi:MAG: nucleotidyltransferase family protein [Aggregatilineales bacterium]
MTHLPVLILAGGLATRLRPITEQIPKILIDVAGRPFAEHQIALLKKHDLTDIVLCVGYLGEQVQQALGDGSRWGVHLTYAFDGPVLLGTGGAIRQARPFLGDAFFVLYGDAYLACDYLAIESAFRASKKLGLMTVFHNKNKWDRSNIIFRDGQIIRYDKRYPTPDMEYIDYGLGILQASALDPYPTDRPFDLAAVYQDLIGRGQIDGYEVAERFYEIGSPTGLEETRQRLAK